MTNSNSDILDESTQRTTGKTALKSNIDAAKAVSEIVKSTLGPMGMDKMLIDSLGNSTITNDGVKILKEMEIEHPGAKLIVEVAKTQENEVGDGTTTAVILCGELLSKAQELISQKLHPTLITKSFKLASIKALEILNTESIEVDPTNKKLIKDICETAMTGKVAEHSKDLLSTIVYDAITTVKTNSGIQLNKIKIQKSATGNINESKIIRGIVLDKDPANVNMPNEIYDAKILLVDFPLEIKELDTDAKISLNSLEEYEQFLKSEESYLKDLVDKIELSGAKVVICQKGIDDNIAYMLSKKGILAIRRTRKSDMEKLSFAIGKRIINSLNDINMDNLGFAQTVSVKQIQNENYIFIEECKNPRAVTIFLKASTSHILDEIERAVDDAIGDINSVIKSKKILAGGGAIELELYKKLIDFSKTFPGREQIIIEAFAKTFLIIPKVLCENCGLDEIDTLTKLISMHDSGFKKSGIDSSNGVVQDTIISKIIEPINVKSQAIKSATESSSMILRIDDIIAARKLSNQDLPDEI